MPSLVGVVPWLLLLLVLTGYSPAGSEDGVSRWRLAKTADFCRRWGGKKQGWCSNGRATSPALCCHPDKDRRAKYVNHAGFERCGSLFDSSDCQPFLAQGREREKERGGEGRGPPALHRAPARDGMKVDLYVKTTHLYKHMLDILLESVQRFWPLRRWQSTFILVLNAEADEDVQLCRTMPKFVRCILSHPLPTDQYLYNKHLTRAFWNQLHADLHSDADWIAILDPDVVFFSPYIPDLLFDWSRRVPRPVVFGDFAPSFVVSVIIWGFPWVAEFMDSFPVVVRPTHLKRIRTLYTNKTELKNTFEAFLTAMESQAGLMFELGWEGDPSSSVHSFSSIVYHFLWNHHRQEFFWSINDGVYTGVDQRHCCPSLRVAAHFGGDRSGWEGFRLSSQRIELEYKARAVNLMLAGERGLQPSADWSAAMTDDLLVKAMITGDHGSWSRSRTPARCYERNLPRLLDTYAQWDSERVEEVG